MFKCPTVMGGIAAKDDKISKLMADVRYAAQRKFDGFRITIEKRGGVVKIWGRGTGKYAQRTEYTEHLPHLVAACELNLPNDTIIDGEAIYVDDNGYENYKGASKVFSSLPEHAIELQLADRWLSFTLFDVLEYDGMDYTNHAFIERDHMAAHIAQNMSSQYITHPEVVFGQDAKAALLDAELMAGREGIMLKNIDSTYVAGKHEGSWYKIKAEKDADCIIIGFTEPDEFTQKMHNGRKMVVDGQPVFARNRYFDNGWIGSITLGQYVAEDKLSKPQLKYLEGLSSHVYLAGLMFHDGIKYLLVPVGNVSSGLADKLRAAISTAKKQYIGKVVEIKYFRETDDSYYLPRFHRFRDDKPAGECVW